ncbi:prepilin-type N-terminal cleavage/methylation domain-containing protein [Thermodesulfobacteriota bacterium]
MKKTQNRRFKLGQGGFNLLEILIAMTIFSIGIMAVASMQISSMMGNTTAKDVTEGATLATDQLEKLMTLSYDSVTTSGRDDGIYRIDWTVTDDFPVTNTKTVNIQVAWTERGLAKAVSLRHVLAKLE